MSRLVTILSMATLASTACTEQADNGAGGSAPATVTDAVSVTTATGEAAASTGAGGVASLRALLVAGGCCHDYTAQKTLITDGISARANVAWDIVHEGSGYDHMVSIYADANWADPYDVIVHDECFAYTTDEQWVGRILAPHYAGKPAVVIHCAMSSYRINGEGWHEFVGVSMTQHEGHRSLSVQNLAPAHPIMLPFGNSWDTPNGELYIIDDVQPTVTPLADAFGVDNGVDYLCVWTNTYGQARVFGTTLGHHNETVADPVYLDMLTRGLLWAVDKLDADGTPLPGYGAAKQ